MKKYILVILTLSLVFLVDYAFGQCAMCKATLQSQENTGFFSGINVGILYLVAIPYLGIAIVGYAWYRNSKKHTAQKVKTMAILNKLKRK